MRNFKSQGNLTALNGVNRIGAPQAWCATGNATSVPSESTWGGNILTVPAGTMSTATGNAFAVDVTVEMTFSVDDTYDLEFSWTNSSDGQTMQGWSYRDVIVVDGTVTIRSHWHCLVEAALTNADWELNALAISTNPIVFEVEFRAIEVNAPIAVCCEWFTPQ